MTVITFRVHGTPAPQGSKAGFVNKHTGLVNMVESSAKVKPWRQDVKYAALEAHTAVCPGGGVHFLKSAPVAVRLTFYLARPKGHYRTGRNAHLLRAAAPAFPTTKPDLDKLVRSTLDGLGEAGIYADDSQVQSISTQKVYDAIPGALIRIEAI